MGQVTYTALWRPSATSETHKKKHTATMYLWSAFSAKYGSTGYGCQSCLWSAEQRKCLFSLYPFAPERLVSRDSFGRPVPPHSNVWLGTLLRIGTVNMLRLYFYSLCVCVRVLYIIVRFRFIGVTRGPNWPAGVFEDGAFILCINVVRVLSAKQPKRGYASQLSLQLSSEDLLSLRPKLRGVAWNITSWGLNRVKRYLHTCPSSLANCLYARVRISVVQHDRASSSKLLCCLWYAVNLFRLKVEIHSAAVR